jgi:hypothetical protein
MNPETKPIFLKPIPENIPDQLKEYDHWVLWEAVFIEDK